MTDWVLAVERAYVRVATGDSVPIGGPPARLPYARAAVGAVASHYLAVGAPRSFGLVVDGPESCEEAALSLVAHQTWFQPTDLRCAGEGADELAREIGGRVTSFAEVLACDIVCLHAPIVLDPAALRRGTHVNVLAPATFADELARVATITHEAPGLGNLAAGLVDGRAFDEITVFVIGDAKIALAAVR
ncbi:MAG: hypothetical protein H0T42_15920 [Deltaproteobacteria bacterium]|nr:hypothetical protein [Deltaproteobacteria bacterium]